jgi:hypothetical protein
MAVAIGVVYSFEATLSPLFQRDREGKAETRGRTQVRAVTAHLGDTQALSVEVTPQGRPTLTKVLDLDEPTDADMRVPVQSKNTQVEITIVNSTPYQSKVTGLDWQGYYNTRASRV